jgi:hypothetical protein
MPFEIGDKVYKTDRTDYGAGTILSHFNKKGKDYYAVRFDSYKYYLTPTDCHDTVAHDELSVLVEDVKEEPKKEEKIVKDPFKQQVGGGHYKSMSIQPVEFILANALGFCEGNIVKYTCRYKQKGGVEDLKKVIHYAELLIAQLEKDKT